METQAFATDDGLPVDDLSALSIDATAAAAAAAVKPSPLPPNHESLVASGDELPVSEEPTLADFVSIVDQVRFALRPMEDMITSHGPYLAEYELSSLLDIVAHLRKALVELETQVVRRVTTTKIASHSFKDVQHVAFERVFRATLFAADVYGAKPLWTVLDRVRHEFAERVDKQRRATADAFHLDFDALNRQYETMVANADCSTAAAAAAAAAADEDVAATLEMTDAKCGKEPTFTH